MNLDQYKGKIVELIDYEKYDGQVIIKFTDGTEIDISSSIGNIVIVNGIWK